MPLTSPRPTGATSNADAAESLQHMAAMRVQARLDAEERLRRHAANVQRLKTFLAFVFFLAVAGGGYWAWSTGRLDTWLGREPPASSQLSAPDQPSAENQKPLRDGRPSKSSRSPEVAAPVRTLEENARAFAETEALFSGATVDYWKNALPADRAGKGKPALLFTALIPDVEVGYRLLSIQMGGKGGLVAGEISPSRGLIELSRKDFDKLVAKTPYLVLREKRAYFCSPGNGSLVEKPLPLPDKGAAFDPAKAEFGALYDCLAKVKVQSPKFRYEVLLNLENLKKRVPVATVAFGETVPHGSFEKAARGLVDDADTVKILLSTGSVVVKAK